MSGAVIWGGGGEGAGEVNRPNLRCAQTQTTMINRSAMRTWVVCESTRPRDRHSTLADK